MPKLFISYRRKSWAFTYRLADELHQRLDAEIFVDLTGVDDADFEKSILRHLRESDAVLLVISEHTFEDRIHKDEDWVRREIREALVLKKPLLLVGVEGRLPPADLPDDIKAVARMQSINFYPEYFATAVDRLAEFVVKLGVAGWRTTPAGGVTVADPAVPPDEKPIAGRATLDEALDLMDHGDYAKAAFLLESLRAEGYTSKYVDVKALLTQAQQEAQTAEMRQRAQQEYEEIAALAARKVTEAHARAAFERWRADYAALVEALDSANLRERFNAKPPTSAAQPKSAQRRSEDILPPPFEWVTIPAGKVKLEEGGYVPKGGQTFDVPAFAIAKYPLTNAQYAKFVEAGGYTAREYWTDAGWQQWEQEKWVEPGFWRDVQLNRADYPVVGVSWYEALAFCRWLRSVTGEGVRLPTEQQWQRAAQGHDRRAYPWGNKFDKEHCNTSESGIGRTTPVTRYPQGASPYGVLDMSGNVWEWCLTRWKDGSIAEEGDEWRVLRGGSWNYDQGYSRAVLRYYVHPDFRSYSFGLRVVRPPSQ